MHAESLLLCRSLLLMLSVYNCAALCFWYWPTICFWCWEFIAGLLFLGWQFIAVPLCVLMLDVYCWAALCFDAWCVLLGRSVFWCLMCIAGPLFDFDADSLLLGSLLFLMLDVYCWAALCFDARCVLLGRSLFLMLIVYCLVALCVWCW